MISPYNPIDNVSINLSTGTIFPNDQFLAGNETFWYWRRSLLDRLYSVIKFELPEEWQGSVAVFFKQILYCNGFLVVSHSDIYGNYFQPCSISGYDLYYQPTMALISNPVFDDSKELKLGEEAELIRLTPDYYGVIDIVNYFAQKLALIDTSIGISLNNTKYPYIVGAKNKSAEKVLKKALDLASEGQPLIVYDATIVDGSSRDDSFEVLQLQKSIKENYVLTDLLSDRQRLIDSFDREVGIPVSTKDKKERLVTAEADSAILDSKARSSTWIECLQTSIGEVNKMFDLNITAELNYKENTDQQKGDDEIGENNT